ncbi:hypothetical protein ABZV34_27305 [Streptomyces sp. NPDC005195]|uniref:hypothetical protein n=1 Tax=Streptomyces sp. NPDC005195 TaxID=3154561 RepID=UPI0033AFE1D8
MTSTLSAAVAVARTLARVLKAFLSLLALASAIVGLPCLLAWATPVIWTATRDDLAHLLDRQDTGAVVLLLLIAVGWIGWAQFTFCVLRELIAQVQGRTWQAPHGLGASQRVAALLVGSILVLLPTSSALAADAHTTAGTAAAHSPGQTAPGSPAAPGDSARAPSAHSATSHPTYTVREMRPAESLWGIAERELGDGERWREIAALNDGHAMAGGQVFKANSFLQPGWQLEMPRSGIPDESVRTQLAGNAPAGSEEREHVVTVRPGDYLSTIAERELGNGDEWPQLFQASQGRPQPQGLPEISDPDMIFAGQEVTVPAAQPHRPAAQQDSDSGQAKNQETDSPTSRTSGGGPTAGQSTTPAPTKPSPSAPSGSPAASPSPSAKAPAPAAVSPTATGPAPVDEPLSLRTVVGAGALLAAAITSALAARRMLQRRRRKPGETIAIAAETSPAEAQLAAAAEPGGATRLDVALRTMAHEAAAQQEDHVSVPVLRAARIGARTLEVFPEDLTEEPATPFIAGKAGWWILPAEAALLDEEAAREVAAPYPGLVTVGSTEAGDLLLLNLARVPALLLDGSAVHIAEVCASLALELGMSPWARDVEVVTVGFGEELPRLLPTARIAHMRHAQHALRDMSERLLEAHQLPDTSHQPYLLLCASPLDPETAWEFADVIDKAGSVPVTLVAPASTTSPHFPQADILNASTSGPQHLDSASTDITMQRLEHASYVQITTALLMSTQPANPPEGPWQNVPDETGHSEQPRPEKPAGKATEAHVDPSPAHAEASGGIFPALLAASTEPPGPQLVQRIGSLPPAGDKSVPAPDAAIPPLPATQQPAAQGTAEEHAVQEGPDPDTDSRTLDRHAPEIRVLGPVEVDGVENTGHGLRMAQLAALLFFRPGRSADVLCAAMDPISSWSTSTLNARIKDLRSALGTDPMGSRYVPRRRSGEDPYRLSEEVRCDWTRFLQFVERALPQGAAGVTDLERALALVRGKPFGGKPLPWAEPYQQEMVTRIIDIAHTIAAYRTPPGRHQNLSAARQAVGTGLDVDDTAEVLYRDWMRIEHAAGNRQGLHTAITRIQHINQTLDCTLEIDTEQLITELLTNTEPGARTRRSGSATGKASARQRSSGATPNNQRV